METRTGTIGLMFSAAIIAALLSGCAPEPEPAASPTPDPTIEEPASSPEPTPTDTSDETESPDRSIPSCEELIGPEFAAEYLGEDWSAVESPEDVRERFVSEFGPVTVATFDDTESHRWCTTLKSDGSEFGSAFIGVLPSEPRDQLIGELRDSVFNELPDEDMIAFGVPPQGSMPLGDSTLWQAFIGDAWIVSLNDVPGREAVAQLRELRPELTQ